MLAGVRFPVGAHIFSFRVSTVVSIPACHAGDPGSIPGLGALCYSHSWCSWLSHPPNTRKVASSILAECKNCFYYFCSYSFLPTMYMYHHDLSMTHHPACASSAPEHTHHGRRPPSVANRNIVSLVTLTDVGEQCVCWWQRRHFADNFGDVAIGENVCAGGICICSLRYRFFRAVARERAT